jgi:hypothetical protein
MNKFLFKLLASIAGKEAALRLAEIKQNYEYELKVEIINYRSRLAENNRYKTESLIDLDNTLAQKRLELSNIKKSIELQETQADRRVAQVNTELQCEKTINFNLKAEVASLTNIIANLTKQIGSKVEIVK